MSELNIPDSWAEASIEDINIRVKQVKPYQEFNYIDIDAVNNKMQQIDNPKKLKAKDAPSRARKPVEKDDVIFSTVRPYLKNIAIVTDIENAIASTGFCVLKPKLLNSLFVFNYLRSPIFMDKIIPLQKGASYPAVSDGVVYEQRIPVPPLAEQKRIVQKIESCFEKIDSTEQNLITAEELLSKYRESLLAKAFRGELIPQNSDDEPASKLLEEIQIEREKNQTGKKKKQEFKPISDDEKPFDIPESWEWVRLEEILDIQSGSTPKGLPLDSTGDHLKFVKVGDMNNSLDGKTIDNVSISFSKETVEKHKIKILPKNTIIFPKRGGAILTNKKRILDSDCACDTNIMGLILPELILKYFWIWFQSIELGNLHTGSTIPQVNNNDIYPLVFPLPPIQEQKRILERLSRSLEVRAKPLVLSRELLNSLKESILSKAFQGELVEQVDSEGTGRELLDRILALKKKIAKKASKK